MATIENLDPEYIPLSEELEQVTQQEPEPLTGEFTSAGAAAKDLRSSNFIEGQQGWRLQQNGTAEFSGLRIRNSIYTVSPTDNLVQIIEKVRSYGGGEIVLTGGTFNLSTDLVMGNSISIRGQGIGQTILDFGGNNAGIEYIGNSTTQVENFFISNLSITNSTKASVINITYCNNFKVSFVEIYSHTYIGFLIDNCLRGLLENCVARDNTGVGAGFYLDGNALTEVKLQVILQNCSSINNYTGFQIAAEYGTLLTLNGCVANDNTYDGFSQTDTANTRVCFFSCTSNDNGQDGFDIDGNFNRIIGCYATGNGQDGFDISGNNNSLVGNDIGDTFTIPDEAISILGGPTGNKLVQDNYFNSFFNTSGSTLYKGDVVVFKTGIADGDEITTTTTQGDDYVAGMVLGVGSATSCANSSTCEILSTGKTISLKVNGTTDIAVGDFLGTYTSAGIAMKAAAGDMAFAIALEAYTTNDSNGVINALLIKPRKI